MDYLSANPGITKWMISADFALHDPRRPVDCMAFTLIPYDALPDDIHKDVKDALPKDLKKSKELTDDGVAWLRNRRRFHVIVGLNKDRTLFYNDQKTDALTVARGHVDLSLSALNRANEPEMLARFRKLKQATAANAFNVGLLTDIYILGTLFASLTVAIGRDRSSEIIGWFPDRDNMTNWCDGIWRDYASGNSHGLCRDLDIDMSHTKLVVGAPDRSGGKEVMWFDYLVRSADWFAGALAAWDREQNQLPTEHRKYMQLIEDVISDADNIVCFNLNVTGETVRCSHLSLTRHHPSPSSVLLNQ